MTTKQPKPDDPAQAKRFTDTAKELGLDESGKAFAKVFQRIVPKAKRHKR